jgi:hypothetical protein
MSKDAGNFQKTVLKNKIFSNAILRKIVKKKSLTPSPLWFWEFCEKQLYCLKPYIIELIHTKFEELFNYFRY